MHRLKKKQMLKIFSSKFVFQVFLSVMLIVLLPRYLFINRAMCDMIYLCSDATMLEIQPANCYVDLEIPDKYQSESHVTPSLPLECFCFCVQKCFVNVVNYSKINVCKKLNVEIFEMGQK